jgi:uncharacterized paraquat-inducible protein A
VTALVHFEHQVLYETTYRAACGVCSERHHYTTDDAQVTCPRCLKALGYKIEPVEQFTQVDDRLRRAA